MADPYIAQITLFAGNFPIRGWAYCAGQLLSISQNTALFSLVGTTYGGDGRVTFGLPDLRGRYPRGHCGGTGPGLSPVQLGSRSGAQTHTLTVQQLAAHTHGLGFNAAEESANQTDPAGHSLAETAANAYSDQTAGAHTGPEATNSTGNNQAFNILDPYLGLNYLIALTGIFPSRN